MLNCTLINSVVGSPKIYSFPVSVFAAHSAHSAHLYGEGHDLRATITINVIGIVKCKRLTYDIFAQSRVPLLIVHLENDRDLCFPGKSYEKNATNFRENLLELPM